MRLSLRHVVLLLAVKYFERNAVVVVVVKHLLRPECAHRWHTGAWGAAEVVSAPSMADDPKANPIFIKFLSSSIYIHVYITVCVCRRRIGAVVGVSADFERAPAEADPAPGAAAAGRGSQRGVSRRVGHARDLLRPRIVRNLIVFRRPEPHPHRPASPSTPHVRRHIFLRLLDDPIRPPRHPQALPHHRSIARIARAIHSYSNLWVILRRLNCQATTRASIGVEPRLSRVHPVHVFAGDFHAVHPRLPHPSSAPHDSIHHLRPRPRPPLALPLLFHPQICPLRLLWAIYCRSSRLLSRPAIPRHDRPRTIGSHYPQDPPAQIQLTTGVYLDPHRVAPLSSPALHTGRRRAV